MDIVTKYKDFSHLPIEEKLVITRNGRPTPTLTIECTSKSRGKTYSRKFNPNVYVKHPWICGCEIKQCLFCFPCILFGNDSNWANTGVSDLVHLSEKAKFHENSKQHIRNEMKFTLLGKTNIQEQLDSAYWQNIADHNEKVAKNRFVLSKILDAIIFCGTFELALRGHDESEDSVNRGIFQGLINYTAEVDKKLKEHLQSATIFKGTSKEIQNDLLDCIFDVYRETISAEINSCDFLGIIADETTDVSSKLQTVIVFRYIKDGKPVERFWGFFTSPQQTADALSSLILTELEPLVGKNADKLIAQSYDGAAVMSGRQGGVQAKIKEKYPLAHFVHCYAHKLNLIMTQAASQNNDVRLFFGNLSEIPTFFSNSSQRVAFLERIVGRKVPRSVPTRWNFKSRTVNVVYEYREELIECMEEIEETSGINITTKNQAGSIRRLLQEKSFVFWLTLFHNIMPHVDILFNELQKRIIDSVEISRCVKKFKENISLIRNQKIYDIMEQAKTMKVFETTRRKLNEENWRASALEICDVIINVAEDRFQYTHQLNAANLFICEKFESYDISFPHNLFKEAIKCYPLLDNQRLKTELSVLYSSKEYRNCSSCVVLLNFLLENNLQTVFQATVKLLKILVTMPMTTVEAERNFSTLKRIKTFLRSTMCQDRLNALACLSIEQKLIRCIPDLNERVIDKFAAKKNRRTDLLFKRN